MTSRHRVLVTGGAGFVGSHVCEQMLARDTEVVCVDNLSTGSLENVAHLVDRDGFRFVEHDISEPLPPLGDFDSILHLASPASPLDYLRLPIETLRTGALGALNLAQLAHEQGARMVVASTSEVYGDPLEHPQTESYWGNVNPVGPRSVYDEGKRFGEAVAAAFRREHRADIGIARIFNTYGPRMRGDDGRMIPAFVCQALEGTPLTVHGDGSHTRSICYVDDTVAGLLALADSDHPGPVNIGNPVEMSVLEIAHIIRDLVGSSSPVVHVTEAVDDPRRRCPDITVARTALGWAPTVPPEEGLRRTIAWFAARSSATTPLPPTTPVRSTTRR